MNLLDSDQEIPPGATTFRYRHRFYYEDYTLPEGRDPFSDNAFFLFGQTEDWNSEYDIREAAPGTWPGAAVHTLVTDMSASYLFGGLTGFVNPKRLDCDPITVGDCGGAQRVADAGGEFELLAASFHQHVGMVEGQLINADTGEMLCRSVGAYGAGEKVLDEAGYVVGIQPCVWNAGDDPSLPQPPRLRLDSNLTSIALYNSTHPHGGVMAMWQLRGGLIRGGRAQESFAGFV